LTIEIVRKLITELRSVVVLLKEKAEIRESVTRGEYEQSRLYAHVEMSE
jgi:hypothetical protein